MKKAAYAVAPIWVLFYILSFLLCCCFYALKGGHSDAQEAME